MKFVLSTRMLQILEQYFGIFQINSKMTY